MPTNNAKRPAVKLVTDEAKPAITAATIAIEAVDPADTIAASAVMDSIIVEYVSSDTKRAMAKDDANKVATAHDSKRVSLILTIVKAAIEGKWELNYALQGVDRAIDAYRKGPGKNSEGDTLTQLRGEIARAIHPKAREHVEHDFERVREQWAAETAAKAEVEKAAREAKKTGTKYQKPKIDTPLHDSFSKSYHAVFQAGGLLDARAKAETPDEKTQIEDLDTFCEARGAKLRRDPKRCASLIKQALKSLEVVSEEYPEAGDDWDTVMDFLKSIDAKRLETLRTMREEEANAAKRQAERKAKLAAGTGLRKAATNAKAASGVDKLTD